MTAPKILYIEDEKFFADTIERALTASGYAVRQARDGAAGLAAVTEWQPQLILLDLLLPQVEGFEVLRRIKANVATQHIPIVVLSNLSAPEDIRRAADLGATHFFVKAVSMPTDIVAVVHKLLPLTSV